MTASIIGSMTNRSAMQQYSFSGGGNRQNTGDTAQSSYTGGTDTVQFSSNIPQSYTYDEFNKAMTIADKISAGKELTASEVNTIKNSRIHAALVALESMNANPEQGRKYVPMMLPRPTHAEIEEAYRRLSQRLDGEVESNDIANTSQGRRATLFESYRGMDLSAIVEVE
jgi:hypothetical protein